MLATIVVDTHLDNDIGAPTTTLREAIAQADPTNGPDVIVFDEDILDDTVKITGGDIIISKRVVIDGLWGRTSKVTIQDDLAPAINGLLFQNFSLSPGGTAADTGVFNVIISGFDVGIKLENLTSGNFDANHPFRIIGNDFTNVGTGIWFENADVPFHIESNVIQGRSSGTGFGISLNNSGQFTATGTLVPTPSIQPTIGRLGAGNTITFFSSGIQITDSTFPALRISGNTIGSQFSPNGTGISFAIGFGGTGVQRIDSNSIVHNMGIGISASNVDGILIDGNRIAENGTHGISFASNSEAHVVRNNLFEHNGADGVAVGPSGAVGSDVHLIEISANNFLRMDVTAGDQPIDLKSDGPTANDTDDSNPGPNRLLNYPVVESLTPNNDVWTAQIRFDTNTGGGTYRLEFYRYDPQRRNFVFIRPENVTALVGGADLVTSFAFTDKIELGDGDRLGVIAIATNGANKGNTSELSVSSLSAMTVPEDGPPQIVDLRLRGSSWAAGVKYSFATATLGGDQLLPVFMQGADIIEVQFSEDVAIAGQPALSLQGTPGNPAPAATFSHYDVITRTAVWTLASALNSDKYALTLLPDSIKDDTNKVLDGEWTNLAAPANSMPTFDNFNDDPVTNDNTFPSGNGTAGGEFQFQFSIMPGDYNQDGVVRNSGSASDLDTLKDGNGDNLVNDADRAIVNNVANTAAAWLAVRKTMGDYADDNDVVNVGDYLVWRSQFGMTGTDLAADGNLSGTVDSADYVLWRSNEGLFSAWVVNSGGMGSGSSLPEVVFGAPPQVINVVVSGSQSAHDPYSFDTVDGSGEQLRTVPVGGADTISIAFSEDVNIQVDHLTLVGLSTASRPGVAEFTYDIPTMTATWRFDDLVANDQYAIVLSQAVTDVEGNSLDGEWTNPASLFTANQAVSQFPSGDGQAGGDFTFVFTLLAGDATRDLIVDQTDYDAMDMSWWRTPAEFVHGDFNGDNTVDMDDYYLVESWDVNLQNLWILGDLNGDWVVDELDEDILLSNISNSNPTWADGDLNGDGSVNINDLDLMYAQYGLDLDIAS